MTNSRSRFSGSHARSVLPIDPAFRTSGRDAASIVRHPAKVIPIRQPHKPSLLNDRKAYLMLHMAIGTALGASLVMLTASVAIRFQIQRSVLSLVVTLAFYTAVTVYYHWKCRRESRLFRRGLLIVLLSAVPVIFLLLR